MDSHERGRSEMSTGVRFYAPTLGNEYGRKSVRPFPRILHDQNIRQIV